MTMLIDTTESLARIRTIVFDNAAPDLLFSFEWLSARDYSGQYADGSLFDQNNPFMIFDASVDEVKRAGPSLASPTRAWGTLGITLHTKNTDDDLSNLRQLEVFSAWFAEKTVRDIRFRTFTPLGTSRAKGFLTFSGVLSFDFEIQQKGL